MKYAFLVGINTYRQCPLRGCVNDVYDMWNLLTTQYGFDKDNIRVLTNNRATYDNIVYRLEWLIEQGKNEGDILVFHYSGHGSQVRDRDGDELSDGLDEIICSYDMSWDRPLTDDIIGEIFSKLKKGVKLTAIFDCCHSGTITRNYSRNRARIKFLFPPLDITLRSRGRTLKVKSFKELPKSDKDLNYVVITGCKDNQTSEDAYIQGRFNGALTWSLVSILKTNKTITYGELILKVQNNLKSFGFSQEPQLECNENLKQLVVFS